MKVINWKAKEGYAKTLTMDQLKFAVKDCIEARDASKGWNEENENYYQDEASIYMRELNKRSSKR